MTQESGKELERRAVYQCKKGNHSLAWRLFDQAATIYRAYGDDIRAAYCVGSAAAEYRLIERTGPVNTSGLVD
jgi:hypothetical protein